MKSTRHIPLILLCVLGLAGCRSPDPLGEMAVTPTDHSIFFELPPESVEAPEEEPWEELVVGKELTLGQCVAITLQRNPKMLRSWHAIHGAAAEVGQERSRYMPSLEASVVRDRSKVQGLTYGTQTLTRKTYDAGVTLRQLILDGGVRSERVRAARAGLRRSIFEHDSLLLDAALETEIAYYSLLATEWLLRVADDMLKQTELHLKVARDRREVGLVRRADVLRIEAERDRARLAVVEASNEIKIRRGRLASSMGLPVSAPIKIKDMPDQIGPAEQGEVEALLKEAIERRPLLRAALAEIGGLEAELKAGKAARLPTFSAVASSGWTDTVLFPDRQEWSLNLELRWLLFSGFDTTYKIREAEANLEGARAGYRALLNDVATQVWEAYSLTIKAAETIEAARKAVDSARESVRVSELEYKEGKATTVELIDAQMQLTRALTSEVQARLDWYSAVAQLERVLGRTLFD